MKEKCLLTFKDGNNINIIVLAGNCKLQSLYNMMLLIEIYIEMNGVCINSLA